MSEAAKLLKATTGISGPHVMAAQFPSNMKYTLLRYLSSLQTLYRQSGLFSYQTSRPLWQYISAVYACLIEISARVLTQMYGNTLCDFVNI
jgi:hypothetical protein